MACALVKKSWASSESSEPVGAAASDGAAVIVKELVVPNCRVEAATEGFEMHADVSAEDEVNGDEALLAPWDAAASLARMSGGPAVHAFEDPGAKFVASDEDGSASS